RRRGVLPAPGDPRGLLGQPHRRPLRRALRVAGGDWVAGHPRPDSMTAMSAPKKWTTPPGPRGLLCHPPLEQWEAVAAANRTVLDGMAFDVAGLPAAELRRSARRRVLAMAGIGGRAEEGLIIVTGHQPQF